MARWTLTISSLYLAVIGLALMFAPLKFGVGAVPADASSELLALLRLLGGPFLGIAALNGLSRSAPAGSCISPPSLADPCLARMRFICLPVSLTGRGGRPKESSTWYRFSFAIITSIKR